MQSASGLLDPPVLAPVSVPGCAVFLWRLFMGFIHSRSCIAFPFYCWKNTSSLMYLGLEEQHESILSSCVLTVVSCS